MATTDDDDVIELERRFWLEGGGEPDFWRTHFDESGIVALAFGIMDKSETVQAMQQGQPWAHVRMDDLRVVSVAEHATLLVYRATAGRDDGTGDYTAVIASVYVQRGDSWRLVFHQQTPAADAFLG